MSSLPIERRSWPERHAWKILFGIAAIFGLFGLGDMLGGGSNFQEGETVLMRSVSGTTWNELKAASPRVANLIDMLSRMGGASLFAVAVLAGIICLRGFRREERWAWIAMWTLPLWMALTVFFIATVNRDQSVGTPVPMISGSILIAVAALALLLSARPFLQRREDSRPAASSGVADAR